MPSFDPRPLLLNPRFRTPGGFTIRRYTTTNDRGVVSRTSVDIPAEGVVVPSGSLGMKITPDTEQQGGGITVYTETPITLGDAALNRPADDILWHGQLYQVTAQDDYSDFGFNVATATLQEPGGRSAS